ncbi:DnaJ domain-containing protein [uncultured Lamprocystis sp.]|jgi:hypothetical protein|uniref:DnaJ domain-containing protein n=1 Tax=uncultured Lamprocystis sp. TaxID=543132 RepID=UPI0025CBE142|nr:DnaJ domain-containing protein [uncultured Lamprocystis sp.]
MPADIAELALACYRTPLAYQDQLAPSASLPPGMDRLLALANGSGSTLDDAARQFGVRPDEVRDAARFLVQRLCFGRGANHYRVLGLTPDTPLEQVKEHHRRLMWLVHPDRVAGRESWTESYAARVNEAWAVLSHPESRARYDAQLQQSEPAPAGDAVGHWPPRRPLVPIGLPGSRTRRLPRPRPPVWRRWLPLAVLGGCGLGAALVVGVVHLSVPSSAPRLYAPAAGSGRRPPPDLPVPPAALELVSAQRIGVLPAEAPRPTALAEVPAERVPVDPVEPVSTSLAPPVVPAQTALTQETRTEPPPAMPVQPKVAPTLTAPVVRAAPAAVSRAPADHPAGEPTLSALEVETLIDRYTAAYRQGDLDGVMALFAPGARGKDGSDRERIRRDYGLLFNGFQVRRLQLLGLRRGLHGDSASVAARYELWLRGRRNGQLAELGGAIRLKLRKRDGQVLIEAIDYDWPSQ